MEKLNAIDAEIKTFYYDNELILKDMSLKVKEGECVVLTGLSGCGKTTLLRLLNGLIPEHYEGNLDGRIEILGRNIEDYQKGELATVMGNVFQEPKEQFFSTVAEDEVAFVGENVAIPRQELISRVEYAFKVLKIEHLKQKSIFEMSGGQMQKVAIASALVSDSKIILLDEPSASLDLNSSFELGKLIKILKEMGKTILISEHRIFYLKDVMDRLVVLCDGKVRADLAGEEIDEELIKKFELRAFDLNTLKGRAEEKFGDQKIKVVDFSIFQGRKKLTESFSLSLHEGEILGVIGRNGVGKTTFLKTLAGLFRERGSISLGNRKARLKNSFMLLQDTDNQLFYATVEDEVLGNFNERDEDFKKKVISGLKEAQLWEKRTHHPHELSGGEKQRLALLIASVTLKDLYLLDEVSSGLDKRRMEFAAKKIKEMAQNAPVILATHDAELLFAVCNRVLVLCDRPYEIKICGNELKILEKMSE